MWTRIGRSLGRTRVTGQRVTPRLQVGAEELSLPPKLPRRVWVAAACLFALSYFVMWSIVHVQIDLRPCSFGLDDPLFYLIPYDRRWYWVTHQLYTAITLTALSALLLECLLGNHRPLVLWGTALGVQAVIRSMTLWLLPLCRATVTPGTPAITAVPYLNLGFISVPWRVWASNDLMFSGHVGEFLLLYWSTLHWPRWLRRGLVGFQIAQAYGLLATRGHYTIDILIAVPCAVFEFRVALRGLLWATRPESSV